MGVPVVGQRVPVEDLPEVSAKAVPADDLPEGFASTPGGAAVGNPMLERYGDKILKQGGDINPFAAIAGSAATGGILGAFSKEILGGGGRLLGSLPYPFARTAGGYLQGLSQTIGASGRVAPTIAGTISGAAGETAGQVTEALGGGPVAAETARVVGSGLTPEIATLGKEVLKKYILTPALSLTSKIKKETAIALLEKIEGAPQSITEKELKYLEQQIAELRGPTGKTDAPLERVGSIMGAEGQRVLSEAEHKMIAAQQQSAGGVAGYPAVSKDLADVGGQLRDVIATRNQAALKTRSEQYKANEKVRDTIVAQQEQNPNIPLRKYVTHVPEYQSLLSELKAELPSRSPSVRAGIEKVLQDLQNPEKDIFGQSKPITFQHLDDVRRKLGDAFRGKPSEGYDAIGEQMAKDLYGKVSTIQEKYAGPAQRKLLDEYASATEGLEIFSSKAGKKATALDQYREGNYANDPSTLPSNYFKTRGSIQALKELTGDPKIVNAAALDYADKELSGKTSAQVRQWMSDNSEWLAETGATRVLVDRYATRLETVERSLRNANEFAAQAAKDSNMLTRQALPAQRAVDLIKSGDTELWSRVAPVIAKSPQAKTQMVNAVRQVVADQATAKSTTDLFVRNIRPFLETSGIATKAEMDFIAQRLNNIQAMTLPEADKLGIAKRIILQATGGWTATAAGREEARAYQMIPD